jgi:D-alanyl-lipoteichoic acid acyltransferase DltB (MBOAT superfamily)
MSCVFYGWWDARFLLLLAFSTTVDFLCARQIAATDVEVTRKRYLLASLISNLGILGFFKYFDFFVTSAHDTLQAIGWNASLPLLHVVLPLGISFYTFQAISYTIDVYRRTIPPSKDPVAFALSVCYFPHLVAGPIQRASFLLPQLEADRRVRWVQIREGIGLILFGLFKKVGVADAIAPLVDLRFTNPALYGAGDLLFALYLFAVQIYCDFSGYSDIARGTSKLFGIELMLNFDHPYFSRSITDFWRRWHISLSTWLREYLYVPLGGNRHGVRKTYRNLMLTMLLGGLWHGASWTFVVWGGLHGLYLAIHKLLLERSRRRVPAVTPAIAAVTTSGPRLRASALMPAMSSDGAAVLQFPGAGGVATLDRSSRGGDIEPTGATGSAGPFGLPASGQLRTLAIDALKIIATFHLVCLAWIFFRADSFTAAGEYLTRMVTLQPAGALEPLNWFGMRTTLLLGVLTAFEVIQMRAGRQTVFTEWHWSARATAYAVLIIVMLVCGGLDANVPFIYFQF